MRIKALVVLALTGGDDYTARQPARSETVQGALCHPALEERSLLLVAVTHWQTCTDITNLVPLWVCPSGVKLNRSPAVLTQDGCLSGRASVSSPDKDFQRCPWNHPQVPSYSPAPPE